jgi:hypothetical protein
MRARHPEDTAAALEAEMRARRGASSPFAVGYFATIGVVTIAWIGGLLWAALVAARWLLS